MFVVFNFFQATKDNYNRIPLGGSREDPEHSCFRAHNGDNFSKDTDGSDTVES